MSLCSAAGQKPAGQQHCKALQRQMHALSQCWLARALHPAAGPHAPAPAAHLGLMGDCVDCMLPSTSSTRDKLKSVTLTLQVESASCRYRSSRDGQLLGWVCRPAAVQQHFLHCPNNFLRTAAVAAHAKRVAPAAARALPTLQAATACGTIRAKL